MRTDNKCISTRIFRACAVGALCLALMTGMPAAAQVLYGSLVGAIEDQSGSVVPKATVTIINKATGLPSETAADDQGRFSLLNVVAGSYDLKVSAPGFRTITETDVTIARS